MTAWGQRPGAGLPLQPRCAAPRETENHPLYTTSQKGSHRD